MFEHLLAGAAEISAGPSGSSRCELRSGKVEGAQQPNQAFLLALDEGWARGEARTARWLEVLQGIPVASQTARGRLDASVSKPTIWYTTGRRNWDLR